MISKAASLSLPASPLATELTGNFARKKNDPAKLRRVYSQVDHVFPGHMDLFDGNRLQSLLPDRLHLRSWSLLEDILGFVEGPLWC